MRNAIGTLDTSSASNPLLDVWLQMPMAANDPRPIFGVPATLTFRILTEQSDGQLVQVFSGTTDLTADQILNPATGLAQPGHYAAAFAVSAFTGVVTPGQRCQIEWAWTLDNGMSGVQVTEFDVLQSVPPQLGEGGYCLVSDMRQEGITQQRCDDRRLLRLIGLASRYLERATGSFFEPRFMSEVVHQPRGRRPIGLRSPVIVLSGIDVGDPTLSSIPPEGYRVIDPQGDPRIEFIHGPFGEVGEWLGGGDWISGRNAHHRELTVHGLFGRLERGACPELIRHATKLIVVREMAKMGSDDREDRKRNRLVAEGTRDQRYQLQPEAEGAFTGDKEIDDIILMFQRPIGVRAV